MPQLTEANGLLKVVDRDKHLFGEAGPKEIIEFEFQFRGSESSIEYIETTCPCIKAWYEPGKIKGTLDTSRIVKSYAPGQTSVEKNFTVMINDGVQRYTANEKKQRQPHPLKRWFSLSVTGVVVV